MRPTDRRGTKERKKERKKPFVGQATNKVLSHSLSSGVFVHERVARGSSRQTFTNDANVTCRQTDKQTDTRSDAKSSLLRFCFINLKKDLCKFHNRILEYVFIYLRKGGRGLLIMEPPC